ncbi:hypothetical protein QLQ12_32480 [Actinoplanes sp. NEAU-A12]|uniref:Nucleoside phosphorylase domain-containing protein n=1 Tax=Actinoplanes sandaracinus TaxID=3045177 RepID=A0ABT6WUA7_9ACTN|nr:hypothetical protein [Actinoplanes sandaracinus]MDI6103336.1 hypothetical protein [Actinoplanes sandaracinus]
MPPSLSHTEAESLARSLTACTSCWPRVSLTDVVIRTGKSSGITGPKREDPSQVGIGIITAITIETLALQHVLDDVAAVRFPGDSHPYHLGTLPSLNPDDPHVIVVAQQTGDGTRDAAWLCGHMPHTFQGLGAFVMCGIAAGVPSADSARNVALGDVVVATEVIDYRHERRVDGNSVLRGAVQPPGAVWMNADHEVEADEMRGRPPWLPTLEAAGEMFRAPTPSGGPRVHRGRVGSADLLLRDRVFRDGLAREHRLLAFEMEGAGLAIGSHLGGRPWYMVRGVADHGDDATKNDLWHPYASLAAAAYLRAVLARCEPFGPRRERIHAEGLDPLNAIADVLAELPVMRDEVHRRAVLDQLPAAIRVQVPENSLGRLHIIQTVNTLQRYPEGLDILLSALRLTLGASSPDFVEVERILRANWRGQ